MDLGCLRRGAETLLLRLLGDVGPYVPRARELRRVRWLLVALWGRRSVGLLHVGLLFAPCPTAETAPQVPFRPGRLAVRRGLS